MAANRLVDLTSLVPGMRQCTITVGENGKTVLHAESGTVKIDRELTSSEMNRLSLIWAMPICRKKANGRRLREW